MRAAPVVSAFASLSVVFCPLPQVQTATKLFSGSSAAFGVEPNTNVAPFDVAMPGTLPSLNRAVVDAAVRLGFALGAPARSERVSVASGSAVAATASNAETHGAPS